MHTGAHVDAQVAAALAHTVTGFAEGHARAELGTSAIIAAAVAAIGIGVTDLPLPSADTRGDAKLIDTVSATTPPISAARLAHGGAGTGVHTDVSVAVVAAAVHVPGAFVIDVETGNVVAASPVGASRGAAVGRLFAHVACRRTRQGGATEVVFVTTVKAAIAAAIGGLSAGGTVRVALRRRTQALTGKAGSIAALRRVVAEPTSFDAVNVRAVSTRLFIEVGLVNLSRRVLSHVSAVRQGVFSIQITQVFGLAEVGSGAAIESISEIRVAVFDAVSAGVHPGIGDGCCGCGRYIVPACKQGRHG